MGIILHISQSCWSDGSATEAHNRPLISTQESWARVESAAPPSKYGSGMSVPWQDPLPSPSDKSLPQTAPQGAAWLITGCIPESGDNTVNTLLWFSVLCPLVKWCVQFPVPTAPLLEIPRDHFKAPAHAFGKWIAFIETSLRILRWGKKTMCVFSYIQQKILLLPFKMFENRKMESFQNNTKIRWR